MDYFSFGGRRRGSSVTQERLDAPLPPGPPTARPASRPVANVGSYESLRAPSSIRIRRLPSGQVPQTPRPITEEGAQNPANEDSAVTGRRRSSSAPQRYGSNLAPPGVDLSRQRTVEDAHMPTITEGQAQRAPATSTPLYHPHQDRAETPQVETQPPTPSINFDGPDSQLDRVTTGASAMQSAANAARANRGLRRFRSGTSISARNERPLPNEYNSDVVDLLDLIDPEVRTIGTLTNVQNSLFVPDLGRWVNRRPTYDITRRTTTTTSVPPPGGQHTGAGTAGRSRAGTGASRSPASHLPTIPQGKPETEGAEDGIELPARLNRTLSISSNLSDSRYAVLPHGITLDGWSEEEKAELDDHVRHLMHSKREGFKRSMRGFRQYISKPLGLFVFVYATLVTLFGAAWVFFLIGWIYVGPRQSFIINVVDNILVALFALIGDGLAPFRAVDTYHMCFIARYHHLTWRLRQEKQLPELVDHNDLPDRRLDDVDIEDQIDKEEQAEFSVLKPIQQRRLQYHQAKFSKAHTFYRPHETSTHHAFPLRLLVAVVVLLDCHSLFQVALGTCTWSINFRVRPEALTATILSCSITCNIVAGIVISIGDHRTRKKDVLERMHRQELTEEALGRMAKTHTDDHVGASIDAQTTSKDEPSEERKTK